MARLTLMLALLPTLFLAGPQSETAMLEMARVSILDDTRLQNHVKRRHE